MAISGNKGEWSEIYTLFRLLGEGKVHAGDAMMNKMDIYYPIINIIREESNRYEYKPDAQRDIVVIDEDGKEYARIPMARFLDESQNLFSGIKSAQGRVFSMPASEAFMNEIGCRSLKAPSGSKADIHIVIHDLRTGMMPLLGFSIKSQLGSASTLLNAGNTTNILYRLSGKDLTDDDIANINGIENHLPRMKALFDMGCKLEYVDTPHDTFRDNLQFLDTSMPRFIAECLVADCEESSTSKVSDVVAVVAKRNPLHYMGKNEEAFYEHKMKVLLVDVALGMTPSKQWLGKYDANGGYLVVRKDGEVVCYHFYNRNDIEDYLYYNTRFERASRSRYGFGSLYRGYDGQVYIKLNLQIRFLK